MTDGCLAVNVIGNHDITCELTTGLSNKSEMEDVYNSKLFVLGQFKRLSIGGEYLDEIDLTILYPIHINQLTLDN